MHLNLSTFSPLIIISYFPCFPHPAFLPAKYTATRCHFQFPSTQHLPEMNFNLVNGWYWRKIMTNITRMARTAQYFRWLLNQLHYTTIFSSVRCIKKTIKFNNIHFVIFCWCDCFAVSLRHSLVRKQCGNQWAQKISRHSHLHKCWHVVVEKQKELDDCNRIVQEPRTLIYLAFLSHETKTAMSLSQLTLT